MRVVIESSGPRLVKSQDVLEGRMAILRSVDGTPSWAALVGKVYYREGHRMVAVPGQGITSGTHCDVGSPAGLDARWEVLPVGSKVILEQEQI